MDEGGRSVPGIKVRGGVLFQADVFSQNQMESIAEMPHYQLDLIDKFREADINALYWKIDEGKNKLSANAASLLPLIDRRETLELELKELPVIESKLAGLKETVGTNAELINRAHAEKALRDRESRAVNEATRIITEIADGTKQCSGILESHFDVLFADGLQEGPNGAFFKRVAARLTASAKEFDRNLAAAVTTLQTAEGHLKKDLVALDSSTPEARTRLPEADRKAQGRNGEIERAECSGEAPKRARL